MHMAKHTNYKCEIKQLSKYIHNSFMCAVINQNKLRSDANGIKETDLQAQQILEEFRNTKDNANYLKLHVTRRYIAATHRYNCGEIYNFELCSRIFVQQKSIIKSV